MTHLFGIRHHGPGCARSLVRALEDLSPDCVLIEGPPEAEAVLAAAIHAEIEPPVALLLYCPDDTKKASFYPLAEFSPEWQAIRFGLQRGLPVRFVDLPQSHDLALRDVQASAPLNEENDAAEAEVEEDISGDPLDWLGRAAGYGDGETWWNQMVEERRDGDSAGLFAAIQEAMTSVRAEIPRKRAPEAEHRENLREAHMRKTIRQAEKDGFQRIAVVCGAWHVPALATMPSAKADNDLLKGLPKVKVAATWAPWTYGRLAAASGYGAGVLSPGWYEFLWRNQATEASQRSIAWISKVARLMREEDIDCSSAHVIEAARLSDALAAMRERPAAGLDEINESIRTVICMGDDAPLRLVRSRLIIGEKLGRVPPDVPTVPLQQDLEKQQRSLRLKPEALAKDLDLDLRNENDLSRSHLLHRLNLLGIKWGEVKGTGRSTKGTFHEVWQLQWQPEFAVSIIEASRWGHTIADAATALAIDHAEKATSLPELSALVDRVLLANLPHAVEPVTHALENLAAIAGDASGGTHGLVSGMASRLLFDEQAEDADATEQRMSQALSIGNDPSPAAAWLEGFLHQSGMILLHDDRLWRILDTWLASLSEDNFTRILPLIRRTFSQFPGTERTQLGSRAKHSGSTTTAPTAIATEFEWNESRALKPLAVLQQILGL